MFYVLLAVSWLLGFWAVGSLQDEALYLYNINQFPAQSGLLLLAVLLLWIIFGSFSVWMFRLARKHYTKQAAQEKNEA